MAGEFKPAHQDSAASLQAQQTQPLITPPNSREIQWKFVPPSHVPTILVIFGRFGTPQDIVVELCVTVFFYYKGGFKVLLEAQAPILLESFPRFRTNLSLMDLATFRLSVRLDV